MDRRLLDILCCPATRQPLECLSGRGLERVNAAIAQGTIHTIDEQPYRQPLEAALITRDHKLLYPIRDGIPVLLPEQAISATQIPDLPA